MNTPSSALKVGLVFGGRSVEHKVSVASARTVARGLGEAGYLVRPLGIGPNGGWVPQEIAQAALDGARDHLPPGDLPVIASLKEVLQDDIDVFFPLIHGTWGEDGTLQGLAEMLDVPYAGASVTTSALAMDKAAFKLLMSAVGLPVVDAVVVTDVELLRSPGPALARLEHLEPPLFVKPSVGGSSVGISKVSSRDQLAGAMREALRFDERIIVEKAVDGRELECAVLGYKDLEGSTVGEIVPGKEFYDYTDKYLEEGAQLIAPAHLSEALAAEVRALSIRAFHAIGGFGMARVDFFLEGPDRLIINEVNTIPGFTDISMYPRLWALSGVPLASLVDRLVAIAIERHADRVKLDRGIKDWIAEVSSRT